MYNDDVLTVKINHLCIGDKNNTMYIEIQSRYCFFVVIEKPQCSVVIFEIISLIYFTSTTAMAIL